MRLFGGACLLLAACELASRLSLPAIGITSERGGSEKERKLTQFCEQTSSDCLGPTREGIKFSSIFPEQLGRRHCRRRLALLFVKQLPESPLRGGLQAFEQTKASLLFTRISSLVIIVSHSSSSSSSSAAAAQSFVANYQQYSK